MQSYDRSVHLALVKSLERLDGNVILTLHNKAMGGRRQSHGTVTFIGVTKVDSLNLRNELVVQDLEDIKPGWRVGGLSFDNGVAVLGVSELDAHESYPVRFTINCSDLKVRMRLALGRTLLNYL